MGNPKGLTNKTTITNGLFIKESRPDVDYFLDRKSEDKLYETFELTTNDSIIKPLSWMFLPNGNFQSSWEFIPDSYTFQQKPLLARDPMAWHKVIDLIHKYHSIQANLPVFEPEEYLEKFRSKIKHSLVDLDEYEEMLQEIIHKHFDLSPSNLVLSHNDMVPGNFLFTNNGQTIQLIDYEYSCLNNRLFDFAGFITETLPTDCEEAFIKTLNLTSYDEDQLRYLIFYCYILWINWSTYMYEQRHDDVYKNLAFEMFDRLTNDEKLKDLEI